MALTEPIIKVKAEVFNEFPQASNGGDQNCRKIKGSTTWSQHAYGNALDIMVPNLAYGDKIATWLTVNRGRFGTGTMLWRVKDHYDHIHIEGMPKMRGTPKCAGGDPEPSTDTRQPEPGFFERITGGDVHKPGGEAAQALQGATGIENPLDALTVIGRATAALFEAETWIRVGLFTGGSIALIGGLSVFATELGMKAIPMGRVAGKLAGAVK